MLLPPKPCLASSQQEAPKVFLDCADCDENYIRSEITFVNYVRRREQADLHILVTTQQAGNGGRQYALDFIGQGPFAGLKDNLRFVTKPSESEDMIRRSMVSRIKMGLVRYMAQTALAEHLDINFEMPQNTQTSSDPWKNWVFTTEIDAALDGEQQRKRIYLYGYLAADRVTKDWKISLYTNENYDESRFALADEKIHSIAKSKNTRGLIVKSLTDHWSLGSKGGSYSSTYENIKISLHMKMIVEYNFFPYAESSRRQWRFQYGLGHDDRHYFEETIFNKNTERLWSQFLSTTLDAKQPWGSASGTLEGGHYLHNPEKNSLSLQTNLNFRLYKGLSLRLSGYASRIRDQLSLPKRGAAEEEILLQRTQLATQYQYYASFGLSYTFGSIYNNVVNPRFGN